MNYQCGQFVAVKWEEEFECVNEENFDCRIEEGNGDEATVGANLEIYDIENCNIQFVLNVCAVSNNEDQWKWQFRKKYISITIASI